MRNIFDESSIGDSHQLHPTLTTYIELPQVLRQEPVLNESVLSSSGDTLSSSFSSLIPVRPEGMPIVLDESVYSDESEPDTEEEGMGYIDQEVTYDSMVWSLSDIFFAHSAEEESAGGPLQCIIFEPQAELDFLKPLSPLTFIPPKPGRPDYTGPFPV